LIRERKFIDDSENEIIKQREKVEAAMKQSRAKLTKQGYLFLRTETSVKKKKFFVIEDGFMMERTVCLQYTDLTFTKGNSNSIGRAFTHLFCKTTARYRSTLF
jgi:hypothetical protein